MKELPKVFYERLELEETSSIGRVLWVAAVKRMASDANTFGFNEKASFLYLNNVGCTEMLSLWTDISEMVTIVYGVASDLLETEVTLWRVTIDIHGQMKTRIYVMENPLDETQFVENILTAIMGNHEVSKEAWSSVPSSRHGEKEGQLLV